MPDLRPGRVARAASPRWNLVKTALQVAIFWTVFFLILPTLLYAIEERLGLPRFHFGSEWLRGVGLGLFAACGLIGLWCGALMALAGRGTPLPVDSTRQLVVVGPYRYVRNPMALVSFLQGVAIGLMCGSPLIVAYGLVGAVGWELLLRPWEERDLAARFGAPYLHYRRHVRCWVPHLRPYTLPAPDRGAAEP